MIIYGGQELVKERKWLTDFQFKAVVNLIVEIIKSSKDLKEAEERALKIIEDSRSKSSE